MEDTVLEENFDVVVIGGGIAGVCAAIAAARHGCGVALIQDRPVLGGNSSNEVRVTIEGASAGGRNPFARETGIIEELLLEDRFRSSLPRPVNGEPRPNWDTLLSEWVTREENLALFLNTRALEAIMDERSGSIHAVRAYQMTTEKEYLFHAPYFIDASGDGTIAFSAGASFRYGRDGRQETNEQLAPLRADREVLGSTLMFSARDAGRPVKFVPPFWAYDYPTDDSIPYRQHDHITAGYWWIEWGGNLDTIADSEQIRDELLRMLYGVWDHIKNHGDHHAENLELDWVGSVVGKRESRRFLGDHILSMNDIDQRPAFPDVVAYGGWPVDIHPATGLKAREQPALQIASPGLYGIPLRSLYSREVPNLFLAGRNISATHLALASARVMGTCAVEGQAVGTAAALCLEHDCLPRELASEHVQELQQLLLKDDCYIPGVSNQDEGDVLRGNPVTESSHFGPLEMVRTDKAIPLDERRAQMFTVSEPFIERVSVWLESEASEEVTVKATLYKARHLTDFSAKEAIAAAIATIPPGRKGWVGFPFRAPAEPGGVYWLALDDRPKLAWGSVEQNLPGTLRAEYMSFRRLWLPKPGCHTFRLTPQSYPFRGSNVLSGCTRPEKGPNLWISDPQRHLPQTLEIGLFNGPIIDTVYLTFDTNLDKLVAFGPAPECVRDYRIQVFDGTSWVTVVEEHGNYQRHRRHQFDPVRAKALRLVVLATNGVPNARVYEMRAYRERAEAEPASEGASGGEGAQAAAEPEASPPPPDDVV